MAVKFTADQQLAIDLHNRDILVSAAAGSGKTAVLSERIAKMVCDKEHPIDVDRMLVVTFTQAAAAEMRERISKRIMDRLNEDGENEHLQRQAALLHNAQITTIDSFCQFILKNNFQDIGIDPIFRVADEGEMQFLKAEVLGELLGEKFEEASESFLNCVEFFCENGREDQLENYILDLHRFSLSFPFPTDWLEERKKDYAFESAKELMESDWMVFYLHHVEKSILGLSEELTRARKLCEEADGPYMYGPMLEKDEEQIQNLLPITDFEVFRAKIEGFVFEALRAKKDPSVNEEKKELVKAIRDKAKKYFESLKKELFLLPMEAVLRESHACQKAMCELIDLCLAFSERFDEKKREKKLIDFSDMEHFALQILIRKEGEEIVPTKTALEYRDYFEEVLIDEYQDSNQVQEYLLWAVSRQESGKRNRFMVGDVKQSIYKFRLARPDLFLEKYRTYSAEDGDEQRIDLKQNFRSRKEVLDTVNTVFENIMTEDIGGIVYDDAAALHLGADYPENGGCESEFLLVEKPGAEMDESAKDVEVYAIAKRIKELMKDFQVTERIKNPETGKEEAHLRELAYKDIVILVRSQNGYDEACKKIFDEFGIPIYVAGKTGYFKTKEVRDVLSFLRVLDNPYQDIPLFAVMKSKFGGFTDEELAVIKAGGNRLKTLYENTKEAALSGDEKCLAFLEKINRYRDLTVYMTIHEILEVLFAEHDYIAYVSAGKNGGKKQANVELLLERAVDFEQNSYYGLFPFIRYIEQMEKFDLDSGEAITLDENADVVRLMTIHKSKGLEFPVAFVAGMGKKFNNMDIRGGLITDTDLGVGIDYVNPDSRVKRKTLRKNVIATKMKLDNLAEELRVLYVAFTRAKEKLILTAGVKDPKETIANKPDSIDYYGMTQASSYLNILLPVFPGPIPVMLEDLAMREADERIDRQLRKEKLLMSEHFGNDEEVWKLKKRLAFSYPYAYLENVYTKTSVSELKMKAMAEKCEEQAKEAFETEEVVPYVPNFIRKDEGPSGAEYGSAMHRVMELLDFSKEYTSTSQIRESMALFEAEGRLSKEYAKMVSPAKVLGFLKSNLGARMKEAFAEGRLYREQPFVMGTEQEYHEIVLIQGIIDAYFEEDGEIVLMDYKTDRIGTAEELVRKYEEQLDQYQRALESLTGKKVKERIIYSFYFEREILL